MKINESAVLDKLKGILCNVEQLENAEQKSLSLVDQLKILVNDLDAAKNGGSDVPVQDASYGDNMFNDVRFDFDKDGKLVPLSNTGDNNETPESDEETVEECKKTKKKKIKESVLKVGSLVKYVKSIKDFGVAKVNRIELAESNKIYGKEVKEVDWSLVNKTSIIDLDNGKWAYGNEIIPINEDGEGGMSSGAYMDASINTPSSAEAVYGLWSIPPKGKRKSKKFKTPMAVRSFLESNENWHELLDECED